MVMTTEQLLSALRLAVNVEYEDSEVTDPAYLKMSDDDLTLFLMLGASKAFPSSESLSDLPDGAAYPLVLLAKKELYLKLAVTNAYDVDLGADNNNYIKQDQRFQHYMKLADSAQQEYDNWKDDEDDINTDPETGISGVRAYNAYLYRGHYTERNYRLQPTIKVRISIAELTTDSVSFSWKAVNNDVFAKYLVYFSTSPIVDRYKDRDSNTASSVINESARLMLSTLDWHNTSHRVTGLQPDTAYYIAVFSIDRNQRYGYAELEFVTPEEVSDEETSENEFGGSDAAKDS